MRVDIFHMEGRGCMYYKLHERIALRSRKLVPYASIYMEWNWLRG